MGSNSKIVRFFIQFWGAESRLIEHQKTDMKQHPHSFLQKNNSSWCILTQYTEELDAILTQLMLQNSLNRRI